MTRSIRRASLWRISTLTVVAASVAGCSGSGRAEGFTVLYEAGTNAPRSCRSGGVARRTSGRCATTAPGRKTHGWRPPPANVKRRTDH